MLDPTCTHQASRHGRAADISGGASTRAQRDDTSISQQITVIQQRQAWRNELFPAGLFRDPAWDILLELYRCHLLRRPCSTKDATLATGVPTGTAKRHLDVLCNAGLVQRTPDPTDARRVFLTLTDQAVLRMFAYFRSV